MKYSLLAAGCAVYALAMLAALHLWPEAARVGLFATYAFAGIAAVTTAFGYAPQDRLRWAWLAFGGGYLIAFAGKVFIGDNTALAQMSGTRVAVWAATIVLLNIGSVTALALFARAWSGTGLAPAWRTRATLIFLAIALVIDGPSLVTSARNILSLRPQAFGFFASVAGDITAVTLVGPIFATAIALRGGLLMRPWLFLFVAAVCWVFDDIAPLMRPEIGLSYDIVFRTLAVTFGGAAALSQLWVKREVRSLSVE
jgi:hypothetical protein